MNLRDAPVYAIDRKAMCNACFHPFTEHAFLYGLGELDLYRCEYKHVGQQCLCGKQYEIMRREVPEGASDAEIETIMQQMGAENDAIRATVATLKRVF